MPETIIYKTCKTCNETKEVSDFYFRSDSQKYRNECKKCWDGTVKKYRKTDAGRESRRREALNYFQSEKGKATHNQCFNKYRLWYPERIKVMSAVAWAIKKGELIRPTICAQCNKEGRIEAHHYKGYAWENRFDIQWLCPLCHRAADSE